MHNQSQHNKMAEKVPSSTTPVGITSAGSALSVTPTDDHLRNNDIIMHNVAIQSLPVDQNASILNPPNAFVRSSSSQQSCASKPANKVSIPGAHTGPRNVVLHRHNGDFGFTLRHFIVYPPDSVTDPIVNPLAAVGVLNFAQPMDTVFVKKVHPNSAAHRAGLQEGDRLLAVNGHTVASIPYSQVVATIQQTPKTLTLQVVPKNYDILQTFFSETAYNPETNQRPQVQAGTPNVSAATLHQEAQQPFSPHLLSMASAQKKQESLYSTLQEIVVENVECSGTSCKQAAIYDEVPKISNRLNPPTQLIPQTMHMIKATGTKGVPGFSTDLLKQQQYSQKQQHLQHQQELQYLEKNTVYDKDGKLFDGPATMNNEVMAEDDYAIPGDQGNNISMSRLRKSLEQKEEFLRRPMTTYDRGVLQSTMHSVASGIDVKDVQHREFYGRPNRFSKLVWPPTTKMSLESREHRPMDPGIANSTDDSSNVSGAVTYPVPEPVNTSLSVRSSAASTASSSTSKVESNSTTRTHVSQLSSIREQFFVGPAVVPENRCESFQISPKSAPPSLTVAASPVRSSSIAGTFSVTSLPLSSHSTHGVSEKTKLFESGRALSPEGFDRMNLYKSELSRINTKQVVPNVAVRRKEFELKAECTNRRMSTEDKQRSSSDCESYRTPVRMRSLSDEPNPTQKPSGRGSFSQMNQFDEDIPKVLNGQNQETVPTSLSLASGAALHQKSMTDSYNSTNRNWTEVATPTVIMRPKQQHSLMIGKDDRKVRRISYLRATARENLFQLIESDAAINSPQPTPEISSETMIEPYETSAANPPKEQDIPILGSEEFTSRKLKSGFVQSVQQKSHCTKSKVLSQFWDSKTDSSAPLLREGDLNVKVMLIAGKRSADRSWRTVHAELRGNCLKITHVRDGKNSTQHTSEPCGTIDLTNFNVTEGNYTKRKYVFKLATGADSYADAEMLLPITERELLLQAESYSDMEQWMTLLRMVCAERTEDANPMHNIDEMSNPGGQQAEPQRIAAQTSVQVHSGNSGDDYSPIMSNKSQRKYVLVSRSPSGQSPVTKTRKTPQIHPVNSGRTVLESMTLESMSTNRQTTVSSIQYQPNQQPLNQLVIHPHHQHYGSGKENSDRDGSSPKSKTWKGIVARQFRKMQGQPSDSGSSAHSADLVVLADGASINVPLQLCPVSDEEPYVPLLLTKCTGIVESKGLSVVGIYRIPGNTAAITQLTETINRGLDEAALSDARWEDVNVVSSLLKSFIRNLPEPLLPKELYGGFISADKLSGVRRLIELRQLLRRTPLMNYETLKHLMRHLYRISTNSEVNLMDPRNLAIVFGPSVVRSANESLETAVKDMRHQCQIVEVLINHYQYFFEDGPLPIVEEQIIDSTVVDVDVEDPSTSLLLDNVSKIEPLKESKETSSGFVANIVQAANRKIRRSAQRKSTMSSTTPDTLSVDSTMSAESKEQSIRIARQRVDIQKSRTIAGSLGSDGKTANQNPAVHLLKTHAVDSCSNSNSSKDIAERGQLHHKLTKKEESLLQLHHHHHHHHHYYHSSRHHSNQSNDDASAVSSRSSEDDSNDSTFADNGDMSLKTVTIALDNKLRSLRNSSIDDSDRDLARECDGDMSSAYELEGAGSVASNNMHHSLHQQYQMGRTSRPLTLGENIPYADESPERPLVQSRSKPLRQAAGCFGVQHSIIAEGKCNTSMITHNSEDVPLKKTIIMQSEEGNTISSTHDSCLTLVNEVGTNAAGVDTDDTNTVATHDGKEGGLGVGSKGRDLLFSSDETDSSTTSNPHEKLTSTTYRIDTEVLKKMNRILTQLERKANNLERKFNLNRSLSLNYKSPKAIDCCCLLQQGGVSSGAGGTLQIPHSHTPLHYWLQQQTQQPHALQQLPTTNNNNNVSNCYNQNSSAAAAGTIRARLSLTKDEKTDKNINRRRLLQDVHGNNIGVVSVGSSSTACPTATSLIDRCYHYESKYTNAACGETSCPHVLMASCHSGSGQTPAANSSGRQRRHAGSRSIRRRHTVGGTHDYLSNKINSQDYHHQYYTGQNCCPLRRT